MNRLALLVLLVGCSSEPAEPKVRVINPTDHSVQVAFTTPSHGKVVFPLGTVAAQRDTCFLVPVYGYPATLLAIGTDTVRSTATIVSDSPRSWVWTVGAEVHATRATCR